MDLNQLIPHDPRVRGTDEFFKLRHYPGVTFDDVEGIDEACAKLKVTWSLHLSQSCVLRSDALR